MTWNGANLQELSLNIIVICVRRNCDGLNRYRVCNSSLKISTSNVVSEGAYYCFHAKSNVPSSNGLLVSAVKSKAKETIPTAAMLLF